MLKNEKGSALLIVLIVVVVLSILGGVLLNILTIDSRGTATIVAKTRAELIANSGIDELESLIREAVVRGSNAVDAKDPLIRIKRTEEIIANLQSINSYEDDYVFDKDEDISGRYEVTVTSRIESQPTITRPDATYVHAMEVSVTATVESPLKQTYTRNKTVYVSDLSPLFRYALSSAPTGTIRINGSPSIIGDGLINNNLLFDPSVRYIDDFGKPNFVRTISPFWRGFLKSRAETFNPVAYSNRFAWPQPYIEKLESGRSDVYQSFELGNTPSDPDRNTLGENNGIVGSKIEKAKLLTGSTQPISPDESGTDLGINAPPREGCSIKCGLDNFSESVSFRDWVTIWGNRSSLQRDLFVDGNLIINDDDSDGASLTMEGSPVLVVRDGIIYIRNVERNFTAANLSGEIIMLDKNNKPAPEAEIIIKGNATLSDFKFNGSMYVQGDVKIVGDLNMTGVLYVTGNVDFKDMRSINPPSDTQSGELGSTLVIAANGPISLNSSRIQSADSDANNKPIRIRAFLYSNSNVELFGVVANYQIIGGVYGQNVTLNALRGDFATIPKPGLLRSTEGYYFEDQQNSRFTRNEAPRLQLQYDPRLFSNPPYGIPWIDEVQVYD